jgi:hypothetical protein
MLSPETKNIQNQLGRYCQTGTLPDIPGINKKYITHYRRLVFNIIRNNLFQAYPIASKVIGRNKFGELIKEFFSEHKAKTPQVWKLPKEFYEFAIDKEWNRKYKYPWLHDLLLFEWMEIQVHTMPDRQIPSVNPKGDLGNDKLVVNQECEIIKLRYPVHVKPVKETTKFKGNYNVLIFRHPVNGTVQFLNLSLIFVSIIEELIKAPATISYLVEGASLNFNMVNKEDLASAFRNFISDMAEKGLILGTLKK